MALVKALFFDIDDTIFDYGKCSRTALENICRRMGVPFSEALLASYRQLDDVLWTKQKKGALTIPQVIKKRSIGMAEKMGIPDAAELFMELLTEELGNLTEPVDGANELLEYTHHAGYALFCASNGIRSMQINRLKKSGFLDYFQRVFVSDEIGYEKPDPRFFEYCLQESGYSANEVLMIGDSMTADIRGALNCGWNACYLNRQDLTPPTACMQVHGLMELKGIL